MRNDQFVDADKLIVIWRWRSRSEEQPRGGGDRGHSNPDGKPGPARSRRPFHYLDREVLGMGRLRENPRYHVLSCRTSDAEFEEIEAIIGDGNRSQFVRDALLEKARRDKQRRFDDALSQ